MQSVRKIRLRAELMLFADIIRGKKLPYPSGDDAAKSLGLIERVYKENRRK